VSEFLLRSRRVVRPEGVGPAALRILGGRIAGVIAGDLDAGGAAAGIPVTDVGDSVVMPGLVDTHVHVNEPGRTEWEGFTTATRAAAAGGVTTLLDMPLNSLPPTTTRQAFHDKVEAAAGRVFVDVGFWGGFVGDNSGELQPLAAAGVFGFKSFLSPSGVPEFPEVAEEDLRGAMESLGNIRLVVHAEWPPHLRPWQGDPRRHAGHLAARPRAAENEAIVRVVRLCRETGTPVHILHLSSAEALETVARAKAEGLPVTAETCPHYLFFAAEEIPDGATEFKCAPPIRERENRERLWAALGEGVLDMIVSDHSPSPPELKHREAGDFARAWGGISSLGLTLSAAWTAASERGYSAGDLARWMCAAPASLAGLADWKGTIAEGKNADLVVWNPEARWTVDPARLHTRHPLTPYAGRELKGVVEATYLKGEKIYSGGEVLPGPRGEILLSG
jgi:allantoinase